MLSEDFPREVSGQRLGIFHFHGLCIVHPHVTAVDKDTQGPVTAGTLQKILHGNALQSFYSAFVCFAQELHEMLKSDPGR